MPWPLVKRSNVHQSMSSQPTSNPPFSTAQQCNFVLRSHKNQPSLLSNCCFYQNSLQILPRGYFPPESRMSTGLKRTPSSPSLSPVQLIASKSDAFGDFTGQQCYRFKPGGSSLKGIKRRRCPSPKRERHMFLKQLPDSHI